MNSTLVHDSIMTIIMPCPHSRLRGQMKWTSISMRSWRFLSGIMVMVGAKDAIRVGRRASSPRPMSSCPPIPPSHPLTLCPRYN